MSAQWIPRHGEAWDAADEEARLFTLSLVNKIVKLSEEEKGRCYRVIQPVIHEYINRAESKGLPGREYGKAIKELIHKYSIH